MIAPCLIVPTLGARSLGRCLDAVAHQELRPSRAVVVLSGPAADLPVPAWTTAVRSAPRLGFAAAINAGLQALADPLPDVALLNDDAVPGPGWLAALATAMDADPTTAGVQGTVLDADGEAVDGRGIVLDRYGLPLQVDRGLPAGPEPAGVRQRLAVSATAVLFRGRALAEARLARGVVLDPAFGSYHEDLDLGLRLRRLGWTVAWTPSALVMHLGSATGRRLAWRHPWWVLANRWRALGGNLTPGALLAALPRLLRGEIRAVRTLAREDAKAWLVAPAALAAVPALLARGLARRSPGPRLAAVPWGKG